MDNADEDDVPDCLCQGFVPEDKRVDFMSVQLDAKTGKPKWRTYLRYHQDCPEHGLNVECGEPQPYVAENPKALRNIMRQKAGS